MVIKSSAGETIPRRLPAAICLSILQVFFSLFAAFIFLLSDYHEISAGLTFVFFIGPAVAAIAMYGVQFRIVSGITDDIDRVLDTLLKSADWVLVSDVRPASLDELRSENAMDRRRLGVSIDNISPEQVLAAMQKIKHKASALGLSNDEYCATSFHRRNGLDPKKADYFQSESLAKTMSED